MTDVHQGGHLKAGETERKDCVSCGRKALVPKGTPDDKVFHDHCRPTTA